MNKNYSKYHGNYDSAKLVEDDFRKVILDEKDLDAIYKINWQPDLEYQKDVRKIIDKLRLENREKKEKQETEVQKKEETERSEFRHEKDFVAGEKRHRENMYLAKIAVGISIFSLIISLISIFK